MIFDIVSKAKDNNKGNPFDEDMSEVDIFSLWTAKNVNSLTQKDEEKSDSMLPKSLRENNVCVFKNTTHQFNGVK